MLYSDEVILPSHYNQPVTLEKQSLEELLVAPTFPFDLAHYEHHRKVVASEPGLWLQVDYMVLSRKDAELYNVYQYYLIGVDIYSRYCVYYINKNAGQFGKGDKTENFINLLDKLEEYPKFVAVDKEFDIIGIKNFCNANDIKLIVSPTGLLYTNSIVDSTIKKLKNYFELYTVKYREEIYKKIKDGISAYNNSVKIMNSIVYFYNRKFNTNIKGIPIEIYQGIQLADTPVTNEIEVPEYKVGQKVYLRPRARRPGEILKYFNIKGLPGVIIEKIGKTKYEVEVVVPGGKIENYYLKWFEFVPVSDELYNKLVLRFRRPE